ncbi:MAG: hypothetical protein M1831_005065 [Alyxoria varia]|nr:MAG: hypothetical protein M1831_005065 [Alyxoria varia]
MDAENGDAFLKDLASFIRSHEKALANSLSRKLQHAKGHAKSSSTGNVSFGRLSFARTSSRDIQRLNPNTLFLTTNQLYYLLNSFEVLDVDCGPMNVRVESIYAPTPSSNYVSFLAQGPRRKSFDQVSTYSVSSVRSGVSSLWSSLTFSGNSEAKAEKQKASLLEDTKYLYSAFTKIPSVKLSVDPRIRRIQGYEEFPFDTAVPVHVFKNLRNLEISDIDFRSIYGWDRLADNLQCLTVKRAGIEDPADLLTSIVLDDVDQRRRRSSKTPPSPGLPGPNPFARPSELAKSSSIPTPSPRNRRISSSDNVRPSDSLRRDVSKTPPQQYGRSMSPRPSSRHMNERPRRRTNRSSHSTPSPPPTAGLSNRTSMTLQTWDTLPPSKWRFLRHLSLADNSLTAIKAESLLPLANSLQSLDLSSNHFTEVPDALSSLVALRAVNLSNCMIDSLRSLFKTPLPAITVLNLRNNRLGSLAGIERLKSLERLDVRDNKLTDPAEMGRLTSMPHFREAFVQGNPFIKSYRSHRITIFNIFRNTPGYTGDIIIDSLGPNYSERRQLSDRAPERNDVQVVRPPYEDELSAGTSKGSAVSGGSRSDLRESTQGNETQDLDKVGEISSSRRKGPRRHVVDIHDNHAVTPRPKQAILESPETAFVTAREARHATPSTETPGSPLHQVDHSLSSREDSALAENDIRKTNYLYQQRIELIRSGQGDSVMDVENPRETANMANEIRAQGISSAG